MTAASLQPARIRVPAMAPWFLHSTIILSICRMVRWAGVEFIGEPKPGACVRPK